MVHEAGTDFVLTPAMEDQLLEALATAERGERLAATQPTSLTQPSTCTCALGAEEAPMLMTRYVLVCRGVDTKGCVVVVRGWPRAQVARHNSEKQADSLANMCSVARCGA